MSQPFDIFMEKTAQNGAGRVVGRGLGGAALGAGIGLGGAELYNRLRGKDDSQSDHRRRRLLAALAGAGAGAGLGAVSAGRSLDRDIETATKDFDELSGLTDEALTALEAERAATGQLGTALTNTRSAKAELGANLERTTGELTRVSQELEATRDQLNKLTEIREAMDASGQPLSPELEAAEEVLRAREATLSLEQVDVTARTTGSTDALRSGEDEAPFWLPRPGVGTGVGAAVGVGTGIVPRPRPSGGGNTPFSANLGRGVRHSAVGAGAGYVGDTLAHTLTDTALRNNFLDHWGTQTGQAGDHANQLLQRWLYGVSGESQ